MSFFVSSESTDEKDEFYKNNESADTFFKNFYIKMVFWYTKAFVYLFSDTIIKVTGKENRYEKDNSHKQPFKKN